MYFDTLSLLSLLFPLLLYRFIVWQAGLPVCKIHSRYFLVQPGVTAVKKDCEIKTESSNVVHRRQGQGGHGDLSSFKKRKIASIDSFWHIIFLRACDWKCFQNASSLWWLWQSYPPLVPPGVNLPPLSSFRGNVVPPGLAYPGSTDSGGQVAPSQRGAAGMSQTGDALGKALASVNHLSYDFLVIFYHSICICHFVNHSKNYYRGAIHRFV